MDPLSAGTAGAGQIEAFHGDVVTVTSNDKTARLTVDGNGPVFSDITPEHETLQTFSTAIVGFTVTDTDSGLRTDREAGTDLDGDDRLDEPLSQDNLGGSADVDVSWLARFGDAREIDGLERRGDRNWVELERDHSYSVSFIQRRPYVRDVRVAHPGVRQGRQQDLERLRRRARHAETHAHGRRSQP